MWKQFRVTCCVCHLDERVTLKRRDITMTVHGVTCQKIIILYNVIYFFESVQLRTGFSWGNPREGDHLEDSGVCGRVILKWILEKWVWGHRLDRSGSGYGHVAGCCECFGFGKMRAIS